MEPKTTNESGNLNLCKFAEQCRNKSCNFNHPTRPDCRFGASCDRRDCWYNHDTQLCRFVNCTNQTCKFRHCTSSSSELSKQFRTPSSLPLPLDHARDPHKISKSEIRAIQNHESEIRLLRDQIIAIRCDAGFNSNNSRAMGIVKTLEKKVSELQLQQLVYQEMRQRAILNCSESELKHQLKRELFRLENKLPALAKRSEIEKHIEASVSRFLIIQGQTGSGKSTQIAQYIVDHPKFSGKRVLCTQPRKIAAVNLATRVSFEYSGGSSLSKPGYQIGFHVGGKKVGGEKCRIEFVTEGIMLEKIMKGTHEAFRNVGCIVIDEAHERSIICDILLGCFKKNDSRWKDILIVVTSATIDLAEFSKFFNNAPTVEIEGRAFPVEIKYAPVPDNCDIKNEVVETALQIHASCKKSEGDILCFLPGQEDVLSAKESFENQIAKRQSQNLLDVKVHALYGKQDPEEQATVFEKLGSGVRKIIFATDVAETSITIDGIVFVVDSGIKKEMVFDPKRNISSLKINVISRSSAIQRAGRSGRTQDGQCIRLYSEEDFEQMSIGAAPEIFRRPLSLAILSLREMNMDPKDFDWISSPSKEAISTAEEELRFLHAVDAEKLPTELGKLISHTQQEPKLVRMVYRGCQEGFGIAAIIIASILTVANMFFWNGNDDETKVQAKKFRQTHAQAEGDIVTMFRLFEKCSELRQQKTGLENNENFVERDRVNTKKLVSAWCRQNFINGKAIALANSAKSELMSIFKYTKVWSLQETQARLPSNTEIQRLVFSGYFLHTARLIYSKFKTKTCQYFALHSEVVGNLDYRAALINHADARASSTADFNPECWIVYDKILRLGSNIFPVTSAIEESWIKEESEEFYTLCTAKTQVLPTERITKEASPEILRSIFGKYFVNMSSLEAKWNCSLDVELESCILRAYCSLKSKPEVNAMIDAKLGQAVKSLQIQVTEEEYMGGTRVVVGQGYEVQQVLFPQEYTTVYIRKLPLNCTSQDVEDMIRTRAGTRLLGQEMDILRSVEIQNYESNTSAVVKFFFKAHAKFAFDILRGEMIEGKIIEVVPAGLGPRRGVTQGETCRLKVSWALTPSSRKAHISFSSPMEANTFIERVDSLFPGARVSRVHGEFQLSSNSNIKKPLPPLRRIANRWLKGVQNMRFETEFNNPQNLNFEYKVTVVDLREYVDEYELLTKAKPGIPKWIKVERVAASADLYENGILVEERQRKLSPLSNFINDDTVTTDFFDKNLNRAGIYVYFEDKLTLQQAYAKADYFALGEMFGQPHRKEIEYTHLTSVHPDLHKFLKSEIEEIKLWAWKRGAVTTANTKSKAGFVQLRFRSCNANVIRQVQDRVEEISKCTKFISERIELLFTWTGRTHLAKLAHKTFLHWNNNTYAIWIYGNEATRKEVVEDLHRVIEFLKSIQVFDKPLVLNRKKLDLKNSKDAVAKMSRLCTSAGLLHYHFNGNTILASGSTDSVQKLEVELEKAKILFTKPLPKLPTMDPDCGLCYCPISRNNPRLLTSVCGHVFCLECIQPMFDIVPCKFPIECPECQTPLVVNDISRCTTQSKLRKFLEVGVAKFERENSTDVCICPNPGCNQLLSHSAKREGQYGGEFIFCDECVATYCVICSTKLEKPVKSHDYESCSDVQRGGPSDEVRQHVKEIQEKIFNLSCPRCHNAFFEFDGCAAVTCGSCPCKFCGVCLMDCGEDAHGHVRTCTKNPNKGSYFVDIGQLNLVHKKMRKQKLKTYLDEIGSQEVRESVQRAIQRDLIDLDIH